MRVTAPNQPDIFAGHAVRRINKCQPEKLLDGQFAGEAMSFLLAWIKQHGPAPFSAEEVTLAAIEAGVAPPDLRHWGEVFQRAAREGYIRRSATPFKRAMGHNTITLGWERC